MPFASTASSPGRIVARRPLALALFVAAIAAAAVAGCSSITGRTGAGDVKTETRQASAFSKIDAGYGINVTVAIGAAKPLELRAQENVLPIIVTEVQGDTLRIRGSSEFNTSTPVEVTVVTPTLTSVSIGGGSSAQVTGIAVDRLEVTVGGGGSITATGTVGALSLTMTGGSHAILADLAAKTVSVELSGGSTAGLRASDDVSGSASGGSHATVAGDARLNVQTSGGAEVTRG
jgi:Putative auto-transporter adhesin, head GIN domain